MALLLLLVFGGVLLWLRFYTNHGQKIEMKDYIGINYKKAAKDAKKHSFELIVKDSVHRVGKPGGLVIAQNPKGGSLVKENRKLYVDITKYEADVYNLSELSDMYGREYNSKAKELAYLNINSKIKGYQHDSGEPNHILEIWYENRLIISSSGRKSDVKIKKGGTLEFVLSKIDGADVPLPDLVCKQYGQVNFLLRMHKLALGGINLADEEAITNREDAYIIAQDPPYSKGAMIKQGQSVEITIQQKQPESCKNL